MLVVRVAVNILLILISLLISSFLNVLFFQKQTLDFTTVIAFYFSGVETGPIAVGGG